MTDCPGFIHPLLTFQKKGLVCLNETVREPIHVNVEPDVFEAMKAALTEMQQSIPTNLVVVKY